MRSFFFCENPTMLTARVLALALVLALASVAASALADCGAHATCMACTAPNNMTSATVPPVCQWDVADACVGRVPVRGLC